MVKKDNLSKVLGHFFDDPLPLGGGFQLREISRKIGLAPKSVKIYLQMLEDENLIVRKEHRIHKYPIYYANRDDSWFKYLKRLNNLLLIKECGLIEYLSDTLLPDSIVLFGSGSKGEDLKGSDFDIYAECEEKKIDLKHFEAKLNRSINVFFEPNFNKLSDELKNNIINGDKLSGYLEVSFKKWKRN